MQKLSLPLLFVLIALMTGQSSARSSALPAPKEEMTVNAPASTVTFEVISRVGGTLSGPVLLDGNYIYTSTQKDFVIMDVSDPARPARVGSLPLTLWEFPSFIDFVKQGSQVFVVGQGRLFIVDVADVFHPNLLGSYSGPGDTTSCVAVSGDYAYIGFNDGLRVVDISEPHQPVAVGEYMALADVSDLAVVGGYAYLALSGIDSAYSGLAILDVSVPTAPSLVTLPAFLHPAQGLAVSGNYAYVAQEGLRIYDISNPSTPTSTGYCFFPVEDSGRRVFIQGNYAYIPALENGVYIINISNPASPVWAGLYDRHAPSDSHWDHPFKYWDVSVAGSYMAVAINYPAGLEIVDISNPAIPVLTGTSTGPGHPIGVTLAGQYAYVIDDVGMAVIDRADVLHAYVVSYPEFDRLGGGVAVSGGYAYVTSASQGLYIFDVSDPAQPIQTALFPLESPAGVAVAGRYAYISGLDSFRILDVSDPAAPIEVGYVDFEAGLLPQAVSVVGKYAYVSAGSLISGFRIIDISNPSQPVIVGAYTTSVPIFDMVIHGRYAYLSAYNGDSLRIWDISNATLPVFIGSGATPDVQVTTLDVFGDYAYLANHFGLYAFDIADPAHPILVGQAGLSGYYGMAADGNDIYVCAYEGLAILRTLQEDATTSISPTGGSFSSAAGDVQLIFPSGAFTQTAEVTYKRLLVDQDTAGLLGIDATFDLSATYAGLPQEAALTPGETFSITVSYTTTQLGPVIEDTLALYYWDGAGNEHRGQWVRDPSSSLEPSSHTLTAASDRLTLWAVLGETKRIYMPTMWR